MISQEANKSRGLSRSESSKIVISAQIFHASSFKDTLGSKNGIGV
jgi:hypothetical protein